MAGVHLPSLHVEEPVGDEAGPRPGARRGHGARAAGQRGHARLHAHRAQAPGGRRSICIRSHPLSQKGGSSKGELGRRDLVRVHSHRIESISPENRRGGDPEDVRQEAAARPQVHLRHLSRRQAERQGPSALRSHRLQAGTGNAAANINVNVSPSTINTSCRRRRWSRRARTST